MTKAQNWVMNNAKEYNFGEESAFQFAERAYIAGATENGIQWHDLRKDPNDLPKHNDYVLVAYEYDDKTYSDRYIDGDWESDYKDPYCSPRVIAWVEKPQFKE